MAWGDALKMAERYLDPPLLKVDVLPMQPGELLRELKDVDWYIIGTHLGFKQSELKAAKRDRNQ